MAKQREPGRYVDPSSREAAVRAQLLTAVDALAPRDVPADAEHRILTQQMYALARQMFALDAIAIELAALNDTLKNR